jgi:hypothetical protein
MISDEQADRLETMELDATGAVVRVATHYS